MIKLHLGCGTVYLEDWINIDACGEMATTTKGKELIELNMTTFNNYYKYPYGKMLDIGNRPGNNGIVVDLKMDITKLKDSHFQHDTVDMILAVSIVEHFTLEDATNMIKDWVFLLKKGGKVLIDVPDLFHTAMDYLDDPINTNEENHYGMSLIYGSQKNEYSFHKWGYTPQSLCKLCRHCGFSFAHEIVPNLIKHKYPMFMVEAVK